MIFGGFLLVAVFAVLGLWLKKMIAKQTQVKNWGQFAAARQLAFADGKIAGVVSGFTVAVFVESRGEGEGTAEYTVVRCSLNGALPPGFRLAKEGLTDKLAQLVGRQDHQLGVAEMDAAFLLERVDDDVRRVLADRTAQERLLAAVARYPDLRIGNGVLQLETSSAVDSEEKLAELLGDAVSVATALQRARR